MHRSKGKVAILIVFYNDLNHLTRLSNSIKNLTYNNFQVYCLDNNPTLNHIEIFTKLVPDSIYLRSEDNKGFALGNNILMKKAISDGCEYLWILNPDMEPEADALEHLVLYMENNSDVGMVGPVLLLGNSKSNPKIQLFGSNVNFKTQQKKSLYADAILNKTTLPEELRVDMINAGSLLVRSEIIKDSYLFEESYFIYNDEIDIAKRFKDQGYNIAVTSLSKVWHHHDWSPRNISGYNMMYYYMMRNKMLYYHKFNMPVRCILEFLKQLTLAQIVLCFCIRTSSLSMFRVYYWGLFHGLFGVKGRSKIKFN